MTAQETVHGMVISSRHAMVSLRNPDGLQQLRAGQFRKMMLSIRTAAALVAARGKTVVMTRSSSLHVSSVMLVARSRTRVQLTPPAHQQFSSNPVSAYSSHPQQRSYKDSTRPIMATSLVPFTFPPS